MNVTSVSVDLKFCPSSEGFSSFRGDEGLSACGKQRSSSKHGSWFPGSILFAEFIATLGVVKTSQMQSNDNADDMLLG
jgi:hypothetical protein